MSSARLSAEHASERAGAEIGQDGGIGHLLTLPGIAAPFNVAHAD
jgi:hypothetical protein